MKLNSIFVSSFYRFMSLPVLAFKGFLNYKKIRLMPPLTLKHMKLILMAKMKKK